MVKEWTFKSESDALVCAAKVNGMVGHNANYTEWYVHAFI